VGLMAARMAAAEILGQDFELPPATTAHGALLAHITGGADSESFQPMNVNFGLMPVPDKDIVAPVQANGKRRKLRGKDRKKAYADRARGDLDIWLDQYGIKAAA